MTVLVPDPLQSDRQYARFYHLDLGGLETWELTEELNYLRPLLWGLDPQHWLRERLQMLEKELAKRRGPALYEPSRKQIPKVAKGVDL